MQKYIPKEIEPKWQKKWQETGIYKFQFPDSSSESSDVRSKPTTDNRQLKTEKYYTLVELPYTSGDLHIGHWFTWAAADAYSRMLRMQGKNVFFPHGFDAFGLPAENAA